MTYLQVYSNYLYYIIFSNPYTLLQPSKAQIMNPLRNSIADKNQIGRLKGPVIFVVLNLISNILKATLLKFKRSYVKGNNFYIVLFQ